MTTRGWGAKRVSRPRRRGRVGTVIEWWHDGTRRRRTVFRYGRKGARTHARDSHWGDLLAGWVFPITRRFRRRS